MKLLLPTILVFISGLLYSQDVAMQPTDVSPLLIGEKVPDTPIKDINGIESSLLKVVSERPTVLVIYRGGWCPFCNAHMADLQIIEEEVYTLGYQIIAVSPDSPENLKASLDKHSISYRLFSDFTMGTIKQMGLAYMASASQKPNLLQASGGNNTGILPVPSLFILDNKGKILFEHVDPNFKERIEGDKIVAVLETLEK